MKVLTKNLTKSMLSGKIDELIPGTNDFITYFKDPKNPEGPKIPKRFTLNFPVLASGKIDGIRCGVHERGVADSVLSRHLKTIPNNFIRNTLATTGLVGLDGELMINDATTLQDFGVVTSGIMTKEGAPNFKFYVFDSFHPDIVGNGFDKRLRFVQMQVRNLNHPNVLFLEHESFTNMADLIDYEERMVALGFEGIMVRSQNGPYKQGRSTEKEGYLLKLKRFIEGEAIITGFEEMVRNANDPFLNERGLQERSSEKAGMVPAGTLGSFEVRDVEHGWEFNVVGGTAKFRQHVWDNRASFLGERLTYKYQPHGMKDKPRIGTFKAMRPKGSY